MGLITNGLILGSGGGTVAVSGSGEINTGSNLGAGQGIFASKSGPTLQFKSLTVGGNLELTSTGTEIKLSAAGGTSGLTQASAESLITSYGYISETSANSKYYTLGGAINTTGSLSIPSIGTNFLSVSTTNGDGLLVSDNNITLNVGNTSGSIDFVDNSTSGSLNLGSNGSFLGGIYLGAVGANLFIKNVLFNDPVTNRVLYYNGSEYEWSDPETLFDSQNTRVSAVTTNAAGTYIYQEQIIANQIKSYTVIGHAYNNSDLTISKNFNLSFGVAREDINNAVLIGGTTNSIINGTQTYNITPIVSASDMKLLVEGSASSSVSWILNIREVV